MNRTRWLVVMLAIGASALIGLLVAGGPSGLSREKAIEWTPPAMTSTPLSTPILTPSSDMIIPTIIVPTPGVTPIASPTKPSASPVIPVLSATPTVQSTPVAATPDSATPVATPVGATPIATPDASTPAATLAPTDGTSID